MQGRGFVSLLQLHWILCSASAIQREELFPFGAHTQDHTLQPGDDETSQVTNLKRPFVFYDTQFSDLYVGTNGIISPQDFPRETQYVDDGFPTDFPVIAPYLSDIDTSNGRGRIYYREDDSPDVLDRAGQEIRRGFPQSSFSPTNAFIATWENVAPYEEITRSDASSDWFNTFQAVLAFDESNTYAIFLYPEDGLQFFGTRPKESYNVQIELPARVGFSRGETGFLLWRSEGPYYSVTSNEQTVKNLYQMGNSGTRGVWVFHIGGTSSFNNVEQAKIGEAPSEGDSIVTLDSTLSGPAMSDTLESEYTETEDYKQYYEDEDEEELEYIPPVSTEPEDRVDGIPDNPPYPDGGIIPSYPEGYPEAGVVSSYPESGALPSYLNRHPEGGAGSRYPGGYSVPESLPRNPLPVTHDRHVVSVEEDERLGAGVFSYSTGTKETCERNQGQCSHHASCTDYSSGFCCHCHSGYYGNGRECLPAGVTQRVNGKVNGKLTVGASRMPVEFQNADLHAYVVVNDGRAFTAISQIPEVVGWAMQSLSIIGDLFGWLFAVEQPGFKNGFSIAGAKFIRNVDITFYPGNEKLNIMQIAQGLDTQNYLSVATEIEGELPNIAQGATVQIQPYNELYHHSSSAMTSTAYREYSVESRNGETQTLRFQLRQNITYYDCEHAPRTIPSTQQLNADRIFVLYDQSEQVVRYAMINQIGPARGNLRPETANPCQDGRHSCDERAQCFPINEREHVCKCAPGYQGDGKVCTDIDECADIGSHECGEHTDCINVPGSYGCECQRGYEILGNGNTCVQVTGRPKTTCEEQRDEVKAEFSPRGNRPHFGMHVPQCDEQGNFRPQQCHSSTGQCWCVDTWGREIPGSRTSPGNNPPQCGLSEPIERPKTACEQHRERLQTELSLRGSLAFVGVHIPECDEDGNFRPMQCHASSGHCWCVYENGQEIPGTRTSPGTSQPQCRLPEHIERPKTACEQHRERLRAELNLREPLVGVHIPECDEEGNFRPLQCHGSTGHCWCVNENGQELPGTRTPPGTGQPQCGQPASNERPKTACEQYRERLQAESYGSQPLVGVHIPECDEEGRFRPLQCHSSTGHCWCVYENGQEIPGTRTPPGTGQPQCGQPEPIERPKTACEQHRERLQTLVGIHIPECDEEGRFRPLQCHGSSGHCWCVYENGQEIPGTRTPPGTGQPQCGQPASNERPKTACELHRERLQAELTLRGPQPLVGIHTPECDEDGNFRPLQCHGSTGYCWCVYENGQEILGTRTPPGTGQPRCGLPAPNERPKTACEQHRERLRAELTLRGPQPLVGIHIPECDEDGNFRPLQCHSSTGYCWCVYENGQEIPGTRTSPGTDQPRCGQPATDERPKTVCEQYREQLQTELSPHESQPRVGVHFPECDEDGNFRPLQCHGSTGHCWCVDERGQEIPGTRTPPGSDQPRCGLPEPVERPKTACEQHRERLQAELSLRGSLAFVGVHIPECDEEGRFRSLQCHSSTGHCWCVNENGQELPGTRTPPGTARPQCGQPEPIERPKTTCEQHRERLQTELSQRAPQSLVGVHIPECDEEGRFRPLQCHSSTGHCWCVYENGQEIPGTRTPPGTGQPRCGLSENVERPKTTCEQHRERLETELNLRGSEHLVGVHIPECDEEGRFRPLQCHGSTGHCWCVYENGQQVPGTRTPPGTGQPECGQPENIERPKTACEQLRERLETELSLRGSQPLGGVHIPECDEEGRFRPLQCHESTDYCWCVTENGQEIPGSRTAPGTGQPQCRLPEHIERPKTACEQHRVRLQTELNRRGSQPPVGIHIPECDEEGRFRPLQCHDSTGHCWCVYENGQEIPGTRTPPGTGQPQCGQPEHIERPKTACEQHRERLQAELNLRGSHVGGHIPECDEEGRFRPLQCHGSTGHCWCVSENGQEIPRTRTPPGTGQPQCGLPEHMERPKTACEQHRERLQAELNLREPLVGGHIPECDEEGKFKPLQCHGSTGHCWCVNENGQEIPGTRTPPGTGQPQCGQPEHIERPKTACEQHRERLLTELSLRGSEHLVGVHIPECDEEGRFRPLQCHGSTGHCWCVYENGQEITGTRTPPGTGQPQCGQPENIERPMTACEQHRERLRAQLNLREPLVGGHIPECDEEGRFRPLQCHGSTGHCWCVNENGQEIPGTRTPPGTGQPQCGQPEHVERPMTACEQHRERLRAELNLPEPLFGGHIPECDEEGRFRPLQCHGSTGHCWCVNENGQDIPGTRTPPGTGQPQCGQPEHIERPKTACEQQRERLQAELNLREPLVGVHIPECDEEGRFRPLQCHSSTGHCWCVNEYGQEIPGTRTPPGTGQPQCGQPEHIERPKTACEQHRERLQTELGLRGSLVGVHIPECDEEGRFRPLQCHSSTGHCWCVYENGQEIPGTRTPPGTGQPQCGQPEHIERPKTACEQHRERLQTELSLRGDLAFVGVQIPECDEDGNFRPLQCHGSTGHCWCVNENGQEIPGTRTPPGTSQPRCGLPEPIEQPKTVCEQHREVLQAEVNLRGSHILVGIHIPECDEEGNFRPLQCHSSTGHCWCVDERGEEIPGTRTPPGTSQPQCGQPEHIERPKTACEQYRERLQAESYGSQPLVGVHIPECDEEGRFRPLQCHSSTGHCWCVYENGQEIPGTRTPPGTGQPRCGLSATIEGPNTACEQLQERLRGSQPHSGVHIPECDEDGNFRPLQCHDSTGHCWCVDERGQEIPGTRTSPGTGQPQCGQPAQTEYPKTACVEQRDQIQAELRLRRPRPAVGAYIPQCDAEGNFRPLQCHSSTGHCWCVDELGREIPGTRTLPGNDQPQCELRGRDPQNVESTQRQPTVCERWRLSLLEHYSGRPADDQYIPECDEFGNFRPLQCHGKSEYCWCVDKEGREIQGTRTEPGSPPACIPTVAPPITQPSAAPIVTPPRTGTFLLYAQGQHIGYLPLNGTQLNKEGAKSLLALHGSIVIGIDYDCRDKMAYWTDVAGRTINRVSLEPGAEPDIIINSDLMSPEGLTIDYLHRSMFWTDSGLDKIETAKVDGSDRRVLVDTDLVNPRGIAVDSLNGNLYWTDWNREAPKIEISRVDGTNRRVLVKNDIGLPNGLTFDPFSSQLCWADAGTKDLECIFSDGTGRHVVQHGLNYPFSIVAYADHFYYTDWRRDGIIVVTKDNNQIIDEYLPDQRSHLYGITVAYPRCPHGRK
ncbi:uncharacterized protein nid2a isoform X4 [Scyliorhinus canicula]|uniref:uncharacterized protein nid2a isoform X4 n=1 Tax=Scyliorhinus canicula TaxID=7830 RepID=UPI0018F34F25|nr:uncharacterized protein nid2a isoform X4 [Scyliorhinus canicula]